MLISNRSIPEEEDDNIVLDVALDSYHSYVTETVGDSALSIRRPLFILRRPTLNVRVAVDTEVAGVMRPSHISLASYYCVAQPCHLDDFLLAQGTESTPGRREQPRLLFGARHRPATFDIQLL